MLEKLIDSYAEVNEVNGDIREKLRKQMCSTFRSYFRSCGKDKKIVKTKIIETLNSPQVEAYGDTYATLISPKTLLWLHSIYEENELIAMIEDCAKTNYAIILLKCSGNLQRKMERYDELKKAFGLKCLLRAKTLLKIKPTCESTVQPNPIILKLAKNEDLQYHLMPYMSQILVATILGLNLGSGVGSALGVASTIYYIWSSISTAHHKKATPKQSSMLFKLKKQLQQEALQLAPKWLLKAKEKFDASMEPIFDNLNLFSYPIRLVVSIASVAWYYSGIYIPIPFFTTSIDSSTMSMILLAYSLGFKNLPKYFYNSQPIMKCREKIANLLSNHLHKA